MFRENRPRRPLVDRLAIRHPGLFHRATSIVMRLPQRSRLRRRFISDGFRRSNRAFNRHDFEAAFALLPSDVEWQTVEEAVGLGIAPATLRGRDAVIELFEKTLLEDFPDWHADLEQLVDLGDGTFVVRATGRGHGRGSGVTVEARLTQVLEMQRGRFVRVREFADHATALEAAGPREG